MGAKPALPALLQAESQSVGFLDPCALADYTLGPVIGTGSFGRVTLASHRSTRTVCAIKALSKAHLLKHQQACPYAYRCLHHALFAQHESRMTAVALKACAVRWGQVSHLRSERDILRQVDHRGIVRLLGSFQVCCCFTCTTIGYLTRTQTSCLPCYSAWNATAAPCAMHMLTARNQPLMSGRNHSVGSGQACLLPAPLKACLVSKL